MALLPPSPIGQPPGNSFWNDWYEKLRTIINTGAVTVAWANVTGTPTTLAGYGITNGQTLLVNSAGLAAALNDETGTGLAVFNNGCTLVAPALGTPVSGNLINCTGFPAAPAGANPSGTIGLVAVNGAAGTFMRSDGAPALSQAIVPTWTGTHTFNNTIVGNISGSAPAGSLSGASLPAGLTGSSLTSVGTLTSLTVAGNTVLGDAQTDTLNVGAGDLIKDASGNFGIGVAPTTKLDMFGGYALIRNASYQIYIGTGLLTTGGAAADICFRSDTGPMLFSFGGTTRATLASTGLLTTGSTTLHATSVALANGAGAGAGTITNAPAAGNPSKWVPIDDNGTTRYIPAW